jgi:hypothetical protein
MHGDGRWIVMHPAPHEQTNEATQGWPGYLLRLVAEYGPREAAHILRALAAEIERLPEDSTEPKTPAFPR